MTAPLVVWDPRMLGYDLGGNHPLHPLRWELTWALAGELGVLDGYQVLAPDPADDETLGRCPHPRLHRRGPGGLARPSRARSGTGSAPPDNPVFPGMHDNAALIAGGSIAAARAIAHGEVDRAVNFCGGLHHAMPDYASGFCVYNDAALAITTLLDAGVRKVAYVDVDAHHGDGVQAAFYDDPRVLTVSIHETPLTLFPGTGFPTECGRGAAQGTSVNIALPAGHGGRRLAAGLPRGGARGGAAFRPEVLVTQHGADSHREDPLADLNLTVDGQRTSYLALRDAGRNGRRRSLAGARRRRVLAGAGGAAGLDAPAGHRRRPRHRPGDPAARGLDRAGRGGPAGRRAADRHDRRHNGSGDLTSRGTGRSDMAVDRAIQDTRNGIYPLHGLDPHDPRD